MRLSLNIRMSLKKMKAIYLEWKSFENDLTYIDIIIIISILKLDYYDEF